MSGPLILASVDVGYLALELRDLRPFSSECVAARSPSSVEPARACIISRRAKMKLVPHSPHFTSPPKRHCSGSIQHRWPRSSFWAPPRLST